MVAGAKGSTETSEQVSNRRLSVNLQATSAPPFLRPPNVPQACAERVKRGTLAERDRLADRTGADLLQLACARTVSGMKRP